MTNYEKHLKSELKDKEFKEMFEKERCKLKISYEMAQLRKKKKMSQEFLAKKLGTSQSVVARMEAGKQNFSLNTLQKIANVFNCGLDVEFTNKR